MLRISKLADYATVVMAYMALNSDELSTARDIAVATHIALPTVSKILKMMVRAELLISTRGTKGGYILSKIPEEITLTDLLQAVDGHFGMTTCSLENQNDRDGDCQLSECCTISNNWKMISVTIFKALQSLTLAQIARPMKANDIPVSHEIFIDAIQHQPTKIFKTESKTKSERE